MSIKTVLFDLDETLIIEYASVDTAFLATCALAKEKHGISAAKLHPVVLEKARELYHGFPLYPWYHAMGLSTWEVLSGDVSGKAEELGILERWQPWYRMEAWRLGLAAFDVEDIALAKTLAESFPAKRDEYHEVYPETPDVIESLQDRYQLGLITNGASKIQRNKLVRCRLEVVFNPIVISGECGIGKPDPKFLRPALRKLKRKSSDVVIVGDRLDTDIQLAKNSGCKSIWINRRKETPPDDAPQPDATLPDLKKLEETLKTL